MEKVQFLEIELPMDKVETYAIIDRGNGEFTSMPKSVYDEQQVEHLTEIPTPDEA